MIKPRLKKSHQVYKNSDGDLAIGEVGPSAYFIQNPPEHLESLLIKLDGTRTMQRLRRDMHREHGVSYDDTDSAVKRLQEAKLLVDEAERSNLLSASEIERYDRQMLQFEALETNGRPGFRYQEQLKRTRVCVLGMGGWGTWLSELLALIGVGKLRLVDADYVENSNLNRQLLYHDEHIGCQKVEAAADTLRRVNPFVEVEYLDQFVEIDQQQIARTLDSMDLAVLCWANQSAFVKETAEQLIHDHCRTAGIDIIEVAGDPFDIGVGPIYTYSKTTFIDLHKVQVQERKEWWPEDNPQLTQFRRESTHAKPIISGNAWQSALSLAMIAGIASNELIRYLSGVETTRTETGRLSINLTTYHINWHDYETFIIDENELDKKQD